MKGKNLLILVVVAVVLVAAALLSSKSRSPKADLMGRLVLPDLPVNSIEKITVSSAAGTTTLSKDGDLWVCRSRFNYPVDFQKVRDTVLKLSDMKVGQLVPLTDKQKGTLKMLPPGSAATNQAGALLELFAARDRKVATLLIGDTRQRKPKTPEGFGGYGGYADGQYISVDGGKSVYLVKDVLQEISANSQDWLDTEIMNINPGDVAAITITSRDKKQVKLNRGKDGSKLEVEGLAADEEAETEKLFNVESALSYLRFVGVTDPAITEAAAGLDKPATYQAETTKGQVITARIGNSPTNTTDSYVRFDVAMKPADTNAPAGTNAVPAGKIAEERAALELETAALAAKLGKWTYLLENYKILSMTSSREQLVKKKEPPKADNAGPSVTTEAVPAPKSAEPAVAAPPAPEADKPAVGAESKNP